MDKKDTIIKNETSRIGIYIMRHGETAENKLRIIQGQEINSKLNETGILQSTKTGLYLKQHGPFDAVYTSSLDRAKQTATHVAKAMGFSENKIVADDRLMESKLGLLSGVKSSEVKDKLPEYYKLREEYRSIKDPILKNKMKATYDTKINKLMGFESDEEVFGRINSFLSDVIKKADKKVLVVTHFGIIEVALLKLFNLDIIPFGPMSKNERNAYVSYIEYDVNEKKYYLVSSPSNIHLES